MTGKMNGIEWIGAWTLHAGHGYGLRGPFLTGGLRWPDHTSWSMQKVLRHLQPRLPLSQSAVARLNMQALDLHGFFELLYELEIAHCNPFAQPGKVLASKRRVAMATDHQVAVATQRANASVAMLTWLVHHIHLAQEIPVAGLAENVADQLLTTARSFVFALSGRGVNITRLTKAATALSLPLRPMPGGMLRIGTGRYAALFFSTISERTPSIGVHVARRKSLAAQFLRMHGLPVPRHVAVRADNVEAAVAAARSIGYPVVVKPDDLDGGVGVHAGLTSEQHLRDCFRLAAEHSPNLLVEKHIPGEDYRITVIDGQVVKAIGRRPGGVTGDGIRSIREILASDAAALREDNPGKKAVELDEEAISMLADAGRTPDDVLPAETFQALRRRANMSTGGTSRDVLEILHPDIARLAIRAAQALRLDIAGIDLITPDIEGSWMDGNAFICEVNAQPQISTEFADDVYVDLLRRRLQGRSRARNVLLVNFDAGAQARADLHHVEAELVRQGETVLCIREDGTWLGGERIAPPESNPFRAAQQAEMSPIATAILACLPVGLLLEHGVPWQQIDHLCLIGAPPQQGLLHSEPIRRLQRLLRGHLQGPMSLCAPGAVQPSPNPGSDDRIESVDTLSHGWPLAPGQATQASP